MMKALFDFLTPITWIFTLICLIGIFTLKHKRSKMSKKD